MLGGEGRLELVSDRPVMRNLSGFQHMGSGSKFNLLGLSPIHFAYLTPAYHMPRTTIGMLAIATRNEGREHLSRTHIFGNKQYTSKTKRDR